jgi:hypothetical protein
MRHIPSRRVTTRIFRLCTTLSRGARVTDELAVKAHHCRIRADERQLFKAFTLDAVGVHRLMNFHHAVLEPLPASPDFTCPEHPDSVLIEQGSERMHVMVFQASSHRSSKAVSSLRSAARSSEAEADCIG